MIYVFYNNDPLAQDQGGGAEHFRGLHRALLKSGLDFRLIAARLQEERTAPHVRYISRSSHFLLYYIALWRWFWLHRASFMDGDVFHFHRNYAAWPKLALCRDKGRVMISYHNVTGRVLRGRLGALAAPIRRAMLFFERRVAKLADAIVCVSNRDRQELAEVIMHGPFDAAGVIPAAFDSALFKAAPSTPPSAGLANHVLVLGRISHQKNVPLAIAAIEHLADTGLEMHLTIAGDGEDSRQLMRRIAESPASHLIRWIGRVPHDDVPKTIQAHGILLLSSRYEASPTVVKEALRSMRPIVSTDVGDVPEWIDEDRTGFVCQPDAASLAQGLRNAMGMILEGRYQPTERLDDVSEDAIMSRVMQLYRRLQAV